MKKENSFMYAFKDNAFTPDDASKGILLFLVFETAISLIYQTTYTMGLTSSLFSYFFNILLDACFVLTVVIIAKNRKNDPVEALRIKKAPNVMQIILCLATSLVCIFGFSALTNCFLQVLYNVGYSSISSDIVIADFGSYIVYTLFVCVIPAVCEEVLFRGLIFTGLKKMGATVGVLGSAFLFMIMHGSPDQTVHQFILGVILALAFLITNNLWIPIIIHFFNNFIAVTYAFLAYGDSASTEVEVVEIYLSQYFIYALISSIIAGCLIYLIFKGFSNINLKRTGDISNEKLYNDNGTIGSEVEYRVLEASQELNVEDKILYDENLPAGQVYANPEIIPDKSLLNNPNRMTSQGRFIMTISVVWLALDWCLALISGFLI